MTTSSVPVNRRHFHSGWTPIAKFFATQSKPVRFMWILFAICMVIALFSSVSVVVHRYLSYVTVLRLDQRGPLDNLPPLAITICLAEHKVDLSNDSSSNSSSSNSDGLSDRIVRGAIRLCNLDDNSTTWKSQLDAKSPMFRLHGHVEINFGTYPSGCYDVEVFEQVPRPPNSLCTTFQLSRSERYRRSFWKMFHITVKLIPPSSVNSTNNTNRHHPVLFIAHERDTFPMDNYGQYFYEYVDRGSRMNLFFSRSITKRLGTSKKPCQSDRVRLFNHTYSYEQVVCKWLTACHEYYHSKCNCLCPLEFFPPSTSHPIMLTSGQLISTASNGQMAVNHHCPQPCRGVKHPMTLINSAQCPPACHSTAFSKVNVMVDQLPDSSLLGLALIQSEGMTEMTEEELYSLAKLFGEIGGISSFCFGFSCVLCFELFELAYWFRVNHRKSRTCETANLSWWRFKRRWWWFTGHSPPSPSPRDQSRIDTRREGSNKHNLRSSVSLVLTTNSANNCTTSDQVGDRSRSDTATDDHLQVNASRPFSLHTLEVIADLNGSLFSVPSQVIGAQKKLDES